MYYYVYHNVKERILYEIRYRNKLTFFHKSIYLYKSPQNRMVARFFEIIKV